MVTDAVVDTDCRALRGLRQLACEKRKDFLIWSFEPDRRSRRLTDSCNLIDLHRLDRPPTYEALKPRFDSAHGGGTLKEEKNTSGPPRFCYPNHEAD